jgi:uncharacterized protein YkwD
MKQIITVLLLVAVLALGFIPGSAAVLGSGTTYTVQPGDSLSEIAAEHGTTVTELVRLNADRYPSLKSNPGLIEPGWVLVMPGMPGGNGDSDTLWGRVVTWVKTQVIPVLQRELKVGTVLQPSAQRGKASGASTSALPTPGPAGASSAIHVGDPASEEAILAMINEERARLGLSPLEMDEDLRARSRERSRDMLERGYFSHYDPVTGEPLCSTYEVIARGQGFGAAGIDGARRAARGWWRSQGHYAVITDGGLHRIGVGVAWSGSIVIVTAQLNP